MLNLYVILNVHTDATGTAIKQAYRHAAQKVHPDREGGSAEQFQAVKLAYDVLRDPERRAKYDATGDCGETPTPRSAAEGKLAELFNSIIDSEEFTGDVIDTARAKITTVLQQLDANLSKLNVHVNKLTNQLGRIASTDELNLYENLLQSKIDEMNKKYDHLTSEKNILTETRKLLDDYSDDRPEEKTPTVAFTVTTKNWT